MKPFTHFDNEICMVFGASGGCCEYIIDGLESRGGAHFYNEILMVLEASGGCCESVIDCLKSPGGCCEAVYAFL